MKKKSRIISGMVGLLFIIAGIITLAKIIQIQLVIGIFLGIAAAFQGGRTVYRYIRLKDKGSFKTNMLLLMGIALLVLAVFFFLSPVIASTVAIYMIAVWFVADAIVSFFTMSKLDPGAKTASLILSIIVLAGGVMLLFYRPLGLIDFLGIIIGTFMIVDGANTILLAFLRNDMAEES